MAFWPGMGINYGHQVSDTSYSTAQIENDFTFLKHCGFTRIRLVFPEYDCTATTLANCHDMVSRALAHGFFVVWAQVAGYGAGTLNATRWNAWKSFVTTTLVPYAMSSGLSELCLGNEHELSADNTTLTASTIRADVRSLAASVKSAGYTGKVSYSTANQSIYRTGWINEGLGSLDLIGWNCYDTITNFTNGLTTLYAAFGSRVYVSEFGCITNGFSDYGNDEDKYYVDVAKRVQALKVSGIQTGYAFCYRDGASGVPANSFGFVQTNGNVHPAFEAIRGERIGVVYTGVTRTVASQRVFV